MSFDRIFLRVWNILQAAAIFKFKNFKIQNFIIMEIWKYKILQISKFENTKFYKYRNLKIQNSRNLEIWKYKILETWKFKYKILEVWNFKNTKC